MRVLFIICFLILFELQSFGQILTAEVDSLNALMQAKRPINLKKFGEAQIDLKDGTGYLKCTIIEIKTTYVIYLKSNTLHDQEIDKIEIIRFKNVPWIVQFNDQKIGQIIFKSNY